MKKLVLFFLIFVFFVSCVEVVENEPETKNESLLVKTPSNTIKNIGKYVLSPSKEAYDSLLVKGYGDVIFVYYPRKFVDTIDGYFLLQEFNDTIKIPNSLVVPLPDTQMVVKGDVVLTWWQSGTGMQRALVLSSKETATPIVYYLDNQFYYYYANDDPLFWIDTLPAGTFLKITDDIMPGRSCSVAGEYVATSYTIINNLGTKVMALSWSGALNVFTTGACEIVPINVKFSEGDSVFTPYLGTYTHGTVKNVYEDIGKMKVAINFIDTIIVITSNIFDTFKIEEDD